MPILHLSQLIGVAAGLEDVGAEVQAPRRLACGPCSRSSRSEREAPRATAARWQLGSRAGAPRGWRCRLGLVRGGLAAARACSRSSSPGCRPSSTACGSRTSPTSTSAFPRAGGARSSAPSTWVGRAAARPRLHHRRPALASERRAAAARAARAAAAAVLRRARQPRLRRHRDPFSQPVDARPSSGRRRCSADEAAELELRGRRVQIVGVDPRTYAGGHGAARRSSPTRTADLRILLCHFPA